MIVFICIPSPPQMNCRFLLKQKIQVFLTARLVFQPFYSLIHPENPLKGQSFIVPAEKEKGGGCRPGIREKKMEGRESVVSFCRSCFAPDTCRYGGPGKPVSFPAVCLHCVHIVHTGFMKRDALFSLVYASQFSGCPFLFKSTRYSDVPSSGFFSPVTVNPCLS